MGLASEETSEAGGETVTVDRLKPEPTIQLRGRFQSAQSRKERRGTQSWAKRFVFFCLRNSAFSASPR